MEPPLLSVCVITYNHVNYIRQAIEGVLMQKASFNFNLIIADDFSTDGTREIVLEYKEKCPEKIELILQTQNVGAAQNWLQLIHHPKSKYIAYLEGDDYWVDDRKIQKQVMFLEQNLDFIFTFHNTLDFSENSSRVMYESLGKTDFDIVDFIPHTFARSVSIVYRRPDAPLPAIFERIKLGDSALFIYLLQFGNAKYFEEVMAHYRIHSSGFWTSRSTRQKVLLRFQLFLDVQKFIKNEYHAVVRNQLYELSLTYFINCLFLRQFSLALDGLKYFLLSPLSFKFSKIYRAGRNLVAKA